MIKNYNVLAEQINNLKNEIGELYCEIQRLEIINKELIEENNYIKNSSKDGI